jgi:hypothetical protein
MAAELKWSKQKQQVSQKMRITYFLSEHSLELYLKILQIKGRARTCKGIFKGRNGSQPQVSNENKRAH